MPLPCYCLLEQTGGQLVYLHVLVLGHDGQALMHNGIDQGSDFLAAYSHDHLKKNAGLMNRPAIQLPQEDATTLTAKPFWKRGLDLNQRPSGYEPDELPTAPPRCKSVMRRLSWAASRKYRDVIHAALPGLW